MAEDLNIWTVIGRLAKDAELTYTNSGYAVVKFTFATNSREKVEGQYQDKASFFQAKMVGKLGESLINYLKKGKRIGITGRLKCDSWKDPEGNWQNFTYVQLVSCQLLDTGGQYEEGGNFQPREAYNRPQGNNPPQSNQYRQQQNYPPQRNQGYQQPQNQPQIARPQNSQVAEPEEFDSELPFF